MAGMFEHGAKIDSAATAAFKAQLNKSGTAGTPGASSPSSPCSRSLEQMGCPRAGSASSSSRDGGPVRRHRHHEPHDRRRRVLRCRAPRAGDLQRHGHRRRLDERGRRSSAWPDVYLTGYGGLAFIMGWTGGYCLVALFSRPTCASSASSRSPTSSARATGQPAALHRHRRRDPVLVHLRGGADLRRRPDHDAPGPAAFEVGIFVGLAGILVCSFLGGMRAVTWTQVGAVHHPDRRLHDAGGGCRSADRRADPQAVYGFQPEKVTAKAKELDRRSQGEAGHRHLPAARR